MPIHTCCNRNSSEKRYEKAIFPARPLFIASQLVPYLLEEQWQYLRYVFGNIAIR